MAQVEEYIDLVESGKTQVPKLVKLAVERHVRDLSNDEFYFDEGKADHIVKFFHRFLKHTKGEWAGSSLKLEPWQKFCMGSIFGWRKRADGTRKYKYAYLEVPRKNGKTTIAAGAALYMFDADREPGAEVFSVATKKDQAKLAHNEAKRMVRTSPSLKKRIGIFKNSIHNIRTNSKFEPLGRDADTMDGLNVHGAIVDEIHAHKTREVWDVIDTATGARRQPLMFGITTAGFDRNTICWELHEHTRKILEGVLTDDSHFGIIYSVDDGEELEWENEELWWKANPNLEVSVKLDDLRRKAIRAKEIPSALNAFLRKHLDIWTQAETRFINPDQWRACESDFHIDELHGKQCYGGLDLSSNDDLTAFALTFPIEKNGIIYYRVLIHFWVPEENIVKRARKDRIPYDLWKQQGYLETTPGNVVDRESILRRISEYYKRFNIVDVAFDRWGAVHIQNDLSGIGIKVVQMGQGYASMAPPTKELETLILTQRLEHTNNPVLTWNIDNLVVQQDAAGNLKPNKEKSSEKIDGAVALIMSLDRAVRREKKGRSIYEDRGPTIIE